MSDPIYSLLVSFCSHSPFVCENFFSVVFNIFFDSKTLMTFDDITPLLKTTGLIQFLHLQDPYSCETKAKPDTNTQPHTHPNCWHCLNVSVSSVSIRGKFWECCKYLHSGSAQTYQGSSKPLWALTCAGQHLSTSAGLCRFTGWAEGSSHLSIFFFFFFYGGLSYLFLYLFASFYVCFKCYVQ